MSRPASADKVFAELRDFQRATARYAFSRLYDTNRPSLRFLVADEVGLGKTLVARGVIAQVVEHLRREGDKRLDIVYICSNAAIARQNLRKLNIAGDEAITQADRFTLLTSEMADLERRRLNLIAVTPSTSLKFGHRAGKFKERALLYAVLRRVWGDEAVAGPGPERVFYLGVGEEGAGKRLRDEAESLQPTNSVVKAFRRQIRIRNDQRGDARRLSLRREFNRLAKVFAEPGGWKQRDRDQRNRFMVELREDLTTVGIKALQPDLVILDEFQRFRSLLDPANPSWATRLAHELFDHTDSRSGRPTRTLLLSATPYRPYTTADETDGDTHFEDFIQTARFLLNDEAAAQHLRTDLRNLRRSLLILDRDGGAAAIEMCRRVSERLRPVMTRTERLASTPDRNGMLSPVPVTVSLGRTDIDGYLATSQASALLRQHDVTEFWKSGPYLLNFMEHYALKKEFDKSIDDGAPEGLTELVTTGRGLLDWDEVSRYRRIDPANGRLRALIEDTLDRGMWRLLWLPPSLRYYETSGPFDEPSARAFTKRLVFSAWHLVPKVISALLSHEAERRIFAASGELDVRTYDDYKLRSNGLLEFRAEGGRPEAMANLSVVVPFVELARLADPFQIAAGIRGSGGQPTSERVKTEAGRRIAAALGPVTEGSPAGGPVDQRWYWAAPALLDVAGDRRAALEWWRRARPKIWTSDDAGQDDSGFAQHLSAARELVTDLQVQPLGRVPDDLIRVLADCALGSPAVCALRSFARVTGRQIGWDASLLHGAARVAWGFRSLFNGADATAVMRASTSSDVFWRAVLEYGVLGHLQAVLDEYIHILKDWRGFLSATGADVIPDLAATANGALSLRTVSYATDIPSVGNGRVRVHRQHMRGRFAIRFGDRAIDEERNQKRAQQASEAFNSPFWPFVLTTTSIGQEGLDFHLYSHAVVHWNLPGNPVDFEQREGRIHRYKGHAVRKNVAHACALDGLGAGTSDPWLAMFTAAAASCERDSGELAPYWVFAPEGSPAHIERHLPLLPLSRDASKLEQLLRAVATYRLSFGQPRQEELLNYLAGRIPPDRLMEIVSSLRVDLSPPRSRS